eukprot:504455_1
MYVQLVHASNKDDLASVPDGMEHVDMERCIHYDALHRMAGELDDVSSNFGLHHSEHLHLFDDRCWHYSELFEHVLVQVPNLPLDYVHYCFVHIGDHQGLTELLLHLNSPVTLKARVC